MNFFFEQQAEQILSESMQISLLSEVSYSNLIEEVYSENYNNIYNEGVMFEKFKEFVKKIITAIKNLIKGLIASSANFFSKLKQLIKNGLMTKMKQAQAKFQAKLLKMKYNRAKKKTEKHYKKINKIDKKAKKTAKKYKKVTGKNIHDWDDEYDEDEYDEDEYDDDDEYVVLTDEDEDDEDEYDGNSRSFSFYDNTSRYYDDEYTDEEEESINYNDRGNNIENISTDYKLDDCPSLLIHFFTAHNAIGAVNKIFSDIQNDFSKFEKYYIKQLDVLGTFDRTYQNDISKIDKLYNEIHSVQKNFASEIEDIKGNYFAVKEKDVLVTVDLVVFANYYRGIDTFYKKLDYVEKFDNKILHSIEKTIKEIESDINSTYLRPRTADNEEWLSSYLKEEDMTEEEFFTMNKKTLSATKDLCSYYQYTSNEKKKIFTSCVSYIAKMVNYFNSDQFSNFKNNFKDELDE